MTAPDLTSAIAEHVRALSAEIGARPVGSAANQRAEDYIARAFAAAGYAVERQAFACSDWALEAASVRSAGQPLACVANPHAPPCDVTAMSVAISDLAHLEATSLRGKIVVLHGALTYEPLMPKNFSFFKIDEQQRLMHRLEEEQAAAVIAVSPGIGAVAPVFEDGDFGIPAVTVDAEAGRGLIARAAEPVSVRIVNHRRPSRGANVIARRAGRSARRLTACAHFDTKPGTPGALDNAAGVAAVLALAATVRDAVPDAGLEFIAFNGEDHYSAAGQVAYLDEYGGGFSGIGLLMNFDGLGYRGDHTTVALFDCPDPLAAIVRERLKANTGLIETQPWPQSDHFMFWQAGVPCLAFTSESALALVQSVIHTTADDASIVDAAAISRAVQFAAEVARDVWPAAP